MRVGFATLGEDEGAIGNEGEVGQPGAVVQV